nr:GspH/FimT family protein [Ghiorsea bivora]
MIAVTSAMVVPSLDISGASLEDESDRLQSTLRFASQEAQLSGQPLRWVATKTGWHFEVLLSDKQQQQNQGFDALSPTLPTTAYIEPSYTWEIYEEPPLQTYQLPAPLIIQAVEQAIEFDFGVEVKSKAQGKEKEPILGQVLFLPDGTTSLSDIILASEDETVKPIVLRVRPGPAGIHLKKEGER